MKHRKARPNPTPSSSENPTWRFRRFKPLLFLCVHVDRFEAQGPLTQYTIHCNAIHYDTHSTPSWAVEVVQLVDARHTEHRQLAEPPRHVEHVDAGCGTANPCWGHSYRSLPRMGDNNRYTNTSTHTPSRDPTDPTERQAGCGTTLPSTRIHPPEIYGLRMRAIRKEGNSPGKTRHLIICSHE